MVMRISVTVVTLAFFALSAVVARVFPKGQRQGREPHQRSRAQVGHGGSLRGMMNAECGMMNDKSQDFFNSSFIIPHSAFS
jgi:hypothetical protein